MEQEQCRLITVAQWQDYQKKTEAVEVLKRKLAQAKPELTEWIELHFGKVRE